MVKVFTLTVTTSGSGSEEKAAELIATIEAKIADIRASLGNIQLDVELVEVVE